jgi:hypothetical protein
MPALLAAIGLSRFSIAAGFGAGQRMATRKAQDPARSRWTGRRAGLGFKNEHAETGKPDYRSDRSRSCGRSAPLVPYQRNNGPAHVDHLVGMGMAAFHRRIVDGGS